MFKNVIRLIPIVTRAPYEHLTNTSICCACVVSGNNQRETKVRFSTEVSRKPKLVFYDLEWTRWFNCHEDEIVQIGAACGTSGSVFKQSVLPIAKKMNPYVRRKIQLDIRRKNPTGPLQVYDMVEEQFLPTVKPEVGFKRFLTWLERISEGRGVYLVSYGREDISVLHSNLGNYNLDTRLDRVVSNYIDFQMYLTHYMKDVPCVALKDLVEKYCDNLAFRPHCAAEDSKALMNVFNNIHQLKEISYEDYMIKIENLKNMKIKSRDKLKEADDPSRTRKII